MVRPMMAHKYAVPDGGWVGGEDCSGPGHLGIAKSVSAVKRMVMPMHIMKVNAMPARGIARMCMHEATQTLCIRVRRPVLQLTYSSSTTRSLRLCVRIRLSVSQCLPQSCVCLSLCICLMGLCFSSRQSLWHSRIPPRTYVDQQTARATFWSSL